MTIDDQIRDEKLQYDINREAAKISALSSGKIDKYEYLTGEEILPSNQQQIIEQAKFTYSPLGKAFEKQIKTIEDQGEKQIKAIQDQGHAKTIKKYDYNYKDSPLISKQKEIFNELEDERLNETTELSKKVNYYNLLYKYKGKSPNGKFDKYDNALDLINKIRNGEMKLSNAKNDQIKSKSYMGEIKKGSKKSKKQKTQHTILKCFAKQGKRLLNFFMIILFIQKIKQPKEQDLNINT